MTLRFSLRALHILLCALSAGCNSASFSTTAERNASVAPYANEKVGQLSLRDFLLARSFLAVDNTKATVGIGSAAAIDRRGYLLTAAHALDSKDTPLQLLSMGSSPALNHILQPQVVWRGDVAKNQPDLAILYVGIPLTEIFEWAPEPKNGGLVFAVGPIYDKNMTTVSYSYAAGRLQDFSRQSKLVPPTTRFDHSAPIHGGDSGGPLATMDGRLLGINTEVFLAFLGWHYGRAIRPDLDWLRQIIDEDFSKRSASKGAGPASN